MFFCLIGGGVCSLAHLSVLGPLDVVGGRRRPGDDALQVDGRGGGDEQLTVSEDADQGH